ncbi:MAG: methionyl-tRNA formyltransferase, partial [Bacteroidales bacterium]|nr:methionyl-tRNA formyltransferase [Bacteroidales bacterium]
MAEKIVLMEHPAKEQTVYKALVENPTNNRIVFMGTPDFAVGCLKALVEAGMNVVAVVTMPDKQKGRGQKMQASPVKEYALQQGLPVMQPENLKDAHFLQALEACRADLQIVVAFRMLPRQVWAMPPLGTFNLHASMLPRYRGAAPIQHAIWNGEKTTGVTTFLLDDNMDTGGILYQQEVPIADSDNAGTLHDKLLAVGAPLVVKTAKDLFEGKVTPQQQNELTAGCGLPTQPLTHNDLTAATPQHLPTAPKIFKNDCLLNPEKTAQELHLQVRALSPYPTAFINLKHKETGEITSLKIFE